MKAEPCAGCDGIGSEHKSSGWGFSADSRPRSLLESNVPSVAPRSPCCWVCGRDSRELVKMGKKQQIPRDLCCCIKETGPDLPHNYCISLSFVNPVNLFIIIIKGGAFPLKYSDIFSLLLLRGAWEKSLNPSRGGSGWFLFVCVWGLLLFVCVCVFSDSSVSTSRVNSGSGRTEFPFASQTLSPHPPAPSLKGEADTPKMPF